METQEMKKESEFRQLETNFQKLVEECNCVKSLSEELNNIINIGSDVRPERELKTKVREKGHDRIVELDAMTLECIEVLTECKRLINLVKERFE